MSVRLNKGAADRAITAAYHRCFNRQQVPVMQLGAIYKVARNAWLVGADVDEAMIAYADAHGVPYNSPRMTGTLARLSG